MASTLNINKYATKKTLSQGMLDIALLTSNAAHLKYVLSVGYDNHEYYTAVLTIIILSLVLQLAAVILFLVVGSLDINKEEYHRTADKLNNAATILIFIITFLNVILNAFDIVNTASQPGKGKTATE